MLCLPKYFDRNGRGFMMASIKNDLTAFESIKEKTRPRYKKTWVEFKDFIGAGDKFYCRSPTEEELSSYLCHLHQEKGAASSSMWKLYSMIQGKVWFQSQTVSKTDYSPQEFRYGYQKKGSNFHKRRD